MFVFPFSSDMTILFLICLIVAVPFVIKSCLGNDHKTHEKVIEQIYLTQLLNEKVTKLKVGQDEKKYAGAVGNGEGDSPQKP